MGVENHFMTVGELRCRHRTRPHEGRRTTAGRPGCHGQCRWCVGMRGRHRDRDRHISRCCGRGGGAVEAR